MGNIYWIISKERTPNLGRFNYLLWIFNKIERTELINIKIINQSILLYFSWRPLSACGEKRRKKNIKKWRLWSLKLRSIKLMDRRTGWHFVWSASPVVFNHSNRIFWNEWGIPDPDMKQTNQTTTLPTIDLPRHRFGEYNFVNLGTPAGQTASLHTHRTMYWVAPQLKTVSSSKRPGQAGETDLFWNTNLNVTFAIFLLCNSCNPKRNF